ncbi:transposase [Desulfuromonas soudanensis]|uniref:transposase n=1 Tax=Desulfuromonas soudanensis TaxID=1603606 RepID=UPI0012F9C4A6|nr:transposase [Desulfuromonas soudanensis]
MADNEVYHVLNRGNGRAEVFHKPADFAAFVTLIGEAKERFPVKVLAYCLMSNHFLCGAPHNTCYVKRELM